ncbi:MAG: hypothetical protein E3J23_08740 [Candidatus Stahlbacteria bacterium]|nr:MAG: hypothetical protein E3J23_08740 [Candidatus Stahlbacteria bacterium]
MGSFFSNMIGYGTAGILFGLIVIDGMWSRHNEKKINEIEKHDERIDAELKGISKKLDLIMNHFTIKGMDK